jgi:hypothetical protein
MSNKPINALLGQLFISLKCRCYMFRCLYIIFGELVACWVTLKFYFKLICITNPCIQCLWTLKQFWMQAVSWFIIIFSGSAAQRGQWPPRHTTFLNHTKRRATVGRTSLRRVIISSHRPLPDNTQQTTIHAPVVFEPTIAAGERP